MQRRSRRRFLGAAAACALALRSPFAGAASAVVVPARSYVGARLMRVEATGMPAMRPDAFGPMTLFVAPTSIAVTPMAIYIADPGLGALLRYDPMLDAMSLVAGARVTRESKIAALPDGSVVVANGQSAPATRYAAGGRALQGLSPPAGNAAYDDVVADAGGRFYALDRVQGRLDELMAHGRGATVLPPGLLPDLPQALAIDRTRLFVAGQVCGCVVAIDLFGARNQEVVADDFGKVAAIAAGDGWLVVLDGGEKRLRVYRDGALVADPAYAELQLVSPQALALANSQLYVADPGARRVASFRLRR